MVTAQSGISTLFSFYFVLMTLDFGILNPLIKSIITTSTLPASDLLITGVICFLLDMHFFSDAGVVDVTNLIRASFHTLTSRLLNCVKY